MFKEFRDFALKGNVIDLAIGVIIGAAFGAIVSSIVDDLFKIASMGTIYRNQGNQSEGFRIPGLQLLAQVLQAQTGAVIDFHAARAHGLGHRPEKQDTDHVASPRRHRPLLPPRFSSSWMDSMRIPRSIALHMS